MFRASRLSRGNRFFPTQVLVTPTVGRSLHPGAVRPKRTFDPYCPCGLGQHRHQPVLLRRAHRDERRHDAGGLPRAPQGGRGPDEAADRAVPDGDLSHPARRSRRATAKADRPRWRVDDVTFAARRATSGAQRPEAARPRDALQDAGAVAAARRHPALPDRAARRSVRHRSDHAGLRAHAAGRRQLRQRAGRLRRRQEDRRRPADLRRGQARAGGDRQAARHLPRRPRQPRHRGVVAVGAALPRDDRPRREDARHLRVDPHRREVRHLGADPRPDRRRQGSRRAHDPRAVAPRSGELPGRELRGAARQPVRIGNLRLRKGRVHRRPRSQARPPRARQRRHAVPRRSRRHVADGAGQAAARARGAPLRAPRRQQVDPRRLPA